MTEGSVFSFLLVALEPTNIMACFAGALIGTLVGVLPGLGPAAAMALALPLTFRLGPTAGLIMLAGIYYGSMYGGSTTSILVNVPGEPASAVTAMEGYKMARRGRAGAALAVSAIGSFVAGTFSVIALQIFAPPLATAALAFGPAEYFGLTLLGAVLLANLTGRDRGKAVLMVVVGLLIATIGLDPIEAVERFTLGQTRALGGISFIAIAAGLFGVAEVMTLMAEGQTKVETFSVKFRDLYPRLDELKRSVAPWLRGSFLGFFVGLVPGPAATIASFVSYGVERRFSKHKEEFGTGAIEGVAGPEAANNAAAGGAMIPLLSLGLPFTPATAILLGGMLLQGVTPGPMLLKDNPEIFWGVIGSFYLGNVMLLVLNLPLVGVFASIVRIAPKYLMPVVLVLCVVGSYGDNGNIFDVWVMVAAGVVGYFMRKADYDAAPLLVGLVLGPVMERSLRQALIISQGDVAGLWASPVSVVMLGGALIAAVVPFALAVLRSRRTAAA